MARAGHGSIEQFWLIIAGQFVNIKPEKKLELYSYNEVIILVACLNHYAMIIFFERNWKFHLHVFLKYFLAFEPGAKGSWQTII